MAATLPSKFRVAGDELWTAIMGQDFGIYDRGFAPGARITLWFGDDYGKVKSPQEQQEGARKSKAGPTVYYNRKQFFGGNFLVETHTVSWHPTLGHPKMADKSTEAMVVFTVTEDGLILTMDEFLDPGFVAAGPRPVPQPATGPAIVERYAGNGGSNGAAIAELFDRIADGEDMWPLFDEKATATQFMASTKGKKFRLRPGKNGKLITSKKGAAVYTNRRQYAGASFAIELHTVSLQGMNAAVPDRRHTLEVAVLLRFDPSSGKIVVLDEYMDPSKMKRDVTTGQTSRM